MWLGIYNVVVFMPSSRRIAFSTRRQVACDAADYQHALVPGHKREVCSRLPADCWMLPTPRCTAAGALVQWLDARTVPPPCRLSKFHEMLLFSTSSCLGRSPLPRTAE